MSRRGSYPRELAVADNVAAGTSVSLLQRFALGALVNGE
jgi:hypothetical protein